MKEREQIGAMDEHEAMSHEEVEATGAVDAYLLGRLPEGEARRFEEHYLSCAECLEQLRVTETLVDGLRHGAARDVARAGLSAWAGLRLHSMRRAWLAAAAVLLLLPTLFLYQQLAQTRHRLDKALAEPRAGAIYLPLSPTRDAGAAASHVVRLGSEAKWVVLSLELQPPVAESYELELRDASGAAIWRSPPVSPNAFDALLVQLPTPLLEAGRYELRAVTESGEASFFFRAEPGVDG